MSIMPLHTVDLEGLRNRATRGKKHHGELISAITGREITRKIETTCRRKPAKLQYRTPKSGQRVSMWISHRGCVPVQNGTIWPLLSLTIRLPLSTGTEVLFMIESVSAMDSRLKFDLNALGVKLFPIICHNSITPEMSGFSQNSFGV